MERPSLSDPPLTLQHKLIRINGDAPADIVWQRIKTALSSVLPFPPPLLLQISPPPLLPFWFSPYPLPLPPHPCPSLTQVIVFTAQIPFVVSTSKHKCTSLSRVCTLPQRAPPGRGNPAAPAACGPARPAQQRHLHSTGPTPRLRPRPCSCSASCATASLEKDNSNFHASFALHSRTQYLGSRTAESAFYPCSIP